MKSIHLLLFVLCLCAGCNRPVYQYLEGPIFGTFYHITYESEKTLDEGIVAEMRRVNASLSMFDTASMLSRLNRGESDRVDSLFVTLFQSAGEVYRETDGAFDITVAPLVNAWGFGYKNDKLPDSEKVETLMRRVGMDKLRLDGDRLQKNVEGVEIDAGAIAKGMGVDRVADYLETQGVSHYMVEIGGEIRAKGKSPKQRSWRVGVDKPKDEPDMFQRDVQLIIGIENGALATSGNYRNFYIRDGKKYAHTIDPRTGYPVQLDMLSATVYTDRCMYADAYATAFMVLGFEKSRGIAERLGLQVCFIYEENGSCKTWMTEGFKKMVVTNAP